MSPMSETSNRTVVCSALFLDIVEYSKKPVSEQLALKQRLNALLLKAMRHVATADRIVLDTGDGAAISFLGNPEDCLFAAMALRDSIAAEGADIQPALLVRMGINLGPVRLIRDINGQLNMIGDGINVAQRIMNFAEPGVVLVSRSYYEVVSCLSNDLFRLFQFEGTHTDKHVREHSVYAITPGTPVAAQPLTEPETALAKSESSTDAAAPIPAPLRSAVPGNHKRLWMAAAAALLLVGGMLAIKSGPVAVKSDASSEVASKISVAPEVEKADEPRVTVQLAILPWGEVYVDDQKKGISPPLKTLVLPPGPHRIEIRNGRFPAYATTIAGAAGAKIKVHHKF